MSERFQNFCEETGRDWKQYSNIHLFEEFADWTKKCYAVVFMNYYPLEVDSLWETRVGAENHIQELTNPSNWSICEMEIRSQDMQ